MQIIYRVISILIMLAVIDGVYFAYKKFIQYVNKRNESSVNATIPIQYPALFLLGGLVCVIFYNKSSMFLEVLKNTFMFGALFILVYLNIVVLKRMIFRTKGSIRSIKSMDKDSIISLFKKKK